MLTLLLLACSGKSSPVDTGPGADPVDLVSPVPSGQARAAIVTAPAALFGGIAAEGQVGDLMLKNDRVRFVVQSVREGAWYIQQGGGVIDADLVRPSGQPGRDLLDEHMPMAGVGRLPVAQSVSVLNDGLDGQPAIVRAEGPAEPMALVIGAVESDALLPTAEMWITTDYILEPDAWLLRMETSIEWRDAASSVEPGDLALVSYEAGTVWRPGAGFDEDGEAAPGFVAIVGEANDLVLGLFPDADGFSESPLQVVLGSIGQVLLGGGPAQEVAEGETITWRRWMGVGPDLATLSGAWWQARGLATEEHSGRVVDDLGAPIPGARVHLRDTEGQVLTVAVSDADGAWSASLPAGQASDAVASGRGKGLHHDVATGAAWSGPYGDPAQNALNIESLSVGSEVSTALGYGLSAPGGLAGEDLVLTRPALLAISTLDGGPAKIEVSFASGDPVSSDPRLVAGRPSGRMADAYLASGSIFVPVEPGSYDVLVHRGARFGYHQERVEVLAGQTQSVSASLPLAYEHPGVLIGDPHSHASPSNDASVSMEARLLSQAAHGVQIHFGTDHDHVVDYGPLLAPLALDTVLATVIADEVSPPLRGHFNTWPLVPQTELPNGGAVLWWMEWRELTSTEGLFQAIRTRMHSAEGGVIQSNHPTSGGLIQAAGYDLGDGSIGDGNRWSNDFDAIEVMNSGGYSDMLPYYFDMVSRGLHPTPVGVSDAHGDDSSTGQSFTFMHLGVDDPSALTDAHLLAMAAARATVISTGPYIEATVDGAWAPGRDLSGPVELMAQVKAADWIQVDRLSLLRDGVVVETITPAGPHTFTLAPEADAAYVLIAEGDQGMSPVYPSRRPWAMTAAIRVDADGDGVWTPPLPALTVNGG